MTQLTIEQVRKIHAVLDTAAPVVAAHPDVVAVWAEHLPSSGMWLPRYEVANGGSTYLSGRTHEPCIAQTFRDAAKYHHIKAESYPGAIRFEAREVAKWPTMKAALSAELINGARQLPFAMWCDWWSPPGANQYDVAQEHTNARRGLCMYREQIHDALHGLVGDGTEESDAAFRSRVVDRLHSDAVHYTFSTSGGVDIGAGDYAARIVSDGSPVFCARDPRYTKPRQVAQPWAVPTGAAVCAVCDSPCQVDDASDLFTAEHGRDYPLCGPCWESNDDEDWEEATSRRILRRADLDDKQIAAMQLRHDERAKKVAKLGETLRQKVEARFPPESRSDRVFSQQNKRFP